MTEIGMAEELLLPSELISVFIVETFSPIQLSIFFDLLIPKQKTIPIGIFYRPPNVSNFLETFTNDLKNINLEKNEVYFLGDFSVNLLFNKKIIF